MCISDRLELPGRLDGQLVGIGENRWKLRVEGAGAFELTAR